MAGDIAKLFRIILDFTSSNAASLDTPQKVANMNKAKSLFNVLKEDTTFLDQLFVSIFNGELDLNIESILGLQATTSTNPWKSLTFKISDIFNIPLGVIEGGMAAIESNTASLYCSKNSTASRKNIYEMQSSFATGNIKSGMASFYSFL